MSRVVDKCHCLAVVAERSSRAQGEVCDIKSRHVSVKNMRSNYNMEPEILTCLKIISMIREGQKVYVRDGVLRLERHSSGLLSAFKRWLSGDSRYITMTYIQNVILNALDRSTDVKYLEEALSGLNALKVTYSDDVTVVARLTVLEEKIQLYIKRNGKNPEGVRGPSDSRKCS